MHFSQSKGWDLWSSDFFWNSHTQSPKRKKACVVSWQTCLPFQDLKSVWKRIKAFRLPLTRQLENLAALKHLITLNYGTIHYLTSKETNSLKKLELWTVNDILKPRPKRANILQKSAFKLYSSIHSIRLRGREDMESPKKRGWMILILFLFLSSIGSHGLVLMNKLASKGRDTSTHTCSCFPSSAHDSQNFFSRSGTPTNMAIRPFLTGWRTRFKSQIGRHYKRCR